jgi:formylglycine-generating enzyme required for sulfatase activity
MTRPLRVFLCHSSNDKPTVRELYKKLRAETWIEPWLDEEELYPGQDWNMEIEKAVEAADAIIVCLSKGSITKEGYVQRELRSVLDFADYKPEGTLYIMPVRLEECEPPRRLRIWQYVDYFEGQRERAFQRLLVSLKRRAGALGLTTEEIKEEPKQEILAKPFAKLLDPSSLVPKKAPDSQDGGKGDELTDSPNSSKRAGKPKPKFRTVFISVTAIFLFLAICYGAGMNYLIQNIPLVTATSTSPKNTLISEPPAHELTETSISSSALSVGSTMVSKKDDMVLVYVPEGEFIMGSDSNDDSDYQDHSDQKPEHRVYLDAFWIDQTEVTNTMYEKCVDAKVCDRPNNNGSLNRENYWRNPEFGNYPVVWVSWNDAAVYCTWAERRLPSEAEWEKAARGTDARMYPWGNTEPNETFLFQTTRVGDTTESGSYPAGASIYGALDMEGNVSEWVNDWYSDTYYQISPASNPLGPGPNDGGKKVMRGGSLISGSDLHVFARYGLEPENSYRDEGFRCAFSP